MFTGRVALITGAFGGIGKALCQVLACNNLKGLTLVDVKEDPEFLVQLQKENAECEMHYVKSDVTIYKDLNDTYKETLKRFKQLDIVINNAGICNEVNPQTQLLINTNSVMNSTVLAMEKYLKKRKKPDDGIILNTCSVLGLFSAEWTPYYSISKQCVLAIGRTLGSDHNYERTGVRIITMCPGFTNTPIFQQAPPPKHYKPIMIDIAKSYKQEPSHVAVEAAKLIFNAENRTVWVIEKDQPAVNIELNDISNYVYIPN